MTVESHNDISLDEIGSRDLVPGTYNEDDTVYNHSSDLSSFLPVNEQHEQELNCNKKAAYPTEPVNRPTVDDQPINEYQTPFLSTLAFPTLFPDSKGDPTNPTLLKDISFGDRVKYLINLVKRLMTIGFIDLQATQDFLTGL